MGLLGAVGEVLSAPQQVVFKTARGVGQIATGDVVGGLSSVGPGAGTITDAVGLTDDLGGKRVTPTQALKPYGVKKLPKGVDTGLTLVADPLNLLTFGAGTAAKRVTATAAKELGDAAAKRLAEQGLKKGLSTGEKEIVRAALVREATEAGAKNAEKTASKLLRKTGQRAKGGVTAVIPFTDKGATLLSGKSASTLGRVSGLTATKDAVKATGPGRALGRALIPGRAVAESVGRDAADEVLAARVGRRGGPRSVPSEDLWRSCHRRTGRVPVGQRPQALRRRDAGKRRRLVRRLPPQLMRREREPLG
jgi:hypothetical protein